MAMFAIWVFFEALTGAGIFLWMGSATYTQHTRDSFAAAAQRVFSSADCCCALRSVFMWMSFRPT